jgi:hypothetical protein
VDREESVDEYDRKLSESVRMRLMIEKCLFKKNSDEFSYDSEYGS